MRHDEDECVCEHDAWKMAPEHCRQKEPSGRVIVFWLTPQASVPPHVAKAMGFLKAGNVLTHAIPSSQLWIKYAKVSGALWQACFSLYPAVP